ASFYTILQVQAQEASRSPLHMRVICDVRWPAVQTRDHTKQPERFHLQRRVQQWIEGGTLWAQSVPFRVDRWDTTLGDQSEVRALRIPEGAEATFSEPGRARLSYNLELGAGEQVTLPFVLVAGSEGLDDL